MSLFSVFQSRKPRREVTTNVKTYAQEFDREPEKEKKGLFGIKKKQEYTPEQEDTMKIENYNEDEEKENVKF